MSKDGSGPKPGPSGGKSGERSSKHGTKKSKKDRSDKPRKDRTEEKGDRSEHRRVKREKSLQKKDRNSYEKLDGESARKSSKRISKKKSLDVYAYNELVIHSSEDDLYGYKDEVNLELEADMGWDPTTYYPLPRKVRELSSPIQANKPIQLHDLSSPAVLGHNNDVDYEPYCKLPYLIYYLTPSIQHLPCYHCSPNHLCQQRRVLSPSSLNTTTVLKL